MQIKKIGVVGCGLMGHGIAQVSAQAGYDVVVVEVEQSFLDKGLGRVRKSLDKLAEKQVEKGKATAEQAKAEADAAFRRIRGSLAKSDLAGCDLVVEAIVEDLGVKKALFAELGRICPPATIFASNTSSFPIAEMAQASGRPSRFVGLHFFNPVQLMRLVEVVRTERTDPEVFAAARSFGESVGKAPVGCKDTPGFVVNRLLVPYMAQAMLMYERGDAALADIDAAMQFGCGYPMGPFTLTDYVGLDTTLSILQGWVKSHPKEPAFVIPKILERKVAEGKLGRKTGEGFYKWDGDKKIG
ncbi:MAG: 3-hydroxyacyl-CoA dehydrogenase NAD-binding domain-containing protein [Planctomycetota bacterium]